MEDNNNRREKRRRQSSFDYDKVSREWNADIVNEGPQKKEKDSYNRKGKGEDGNAPRSSTETVPLPPHHQSKGAESTVKSIIKKILFIPLCLLALFGLLVIIGVLIDDSDDNSGKETAVMLETDTIVAYDTCVVDTVIPDSVVDDLLDSPIVEASKPQTNYSEIVANYKSKAKKTLSIYVKAEVLFALKKEFENLPEEARKMMPKEEKQLYYYNMFFIATSPKDIAPLKKYAKAYFTAEQVWMIERTYLHSSKRFYEVYKRAGMSFSGARDVYLKKGWK